MTTRSAYDPFSAAEMANRRARKDLEGYSRAFAVRDRLVGPTSAPLSREEQREPGAKDK